jgi:hypothetical protein
MLPRSALLALALALPPSLPSAQGPEGRLGAIKGSKSVAIAYRSDAIVEIYGRWFGSLGKPGGLLRAMYLFGAIPE